MRNDRGDRVAIDYGEKERQFLDSLLPDTGRSLDDWMAAIRATGLTEKNEVIDWLRRQGFAFSKASWLERIHNNGGKPIYGEKGIRLARKGPPTMLGAKPLPQPRPQASLIAIPAPEAPLAATPPAVGSEPRHPQMHVIVPPRAPAVPTHETTAQPADDAAATMTLLAKAKAYRPLAQYVLTEIKKIASASEVKPHANHFTIGAPDAPFAVLTVSARDVRLGLRLPGTPLDGGFVAAKLGAAVPPIPAAITHMIVLTDARQVNETLLQRVRYAASA